MRNSKLNWYNYRWVLDNKVFRGGVSSFNSFWEKLQESTKAEIDLWKKI